MNLMDVSNSRNARLEEERQNRERNLKNKRFGLQLWRVCNGGVFIFFIMANYLMRQQQPSWPPPGISRLDAGIPALISLGLLLSGWTASRVLAASKNNNREGILRNIIVTLALGVVFLIGFGMVWRQVPGTGSYTAIFFTMTGFHAFHVLAGMLLLAFVYRKAQRGDYTSDNNWSLEASVIFWHFVDLMWILYFVVLYVL